MCHCVEPAIHHAQCISQIILPILTSREIGKVCSDSGIARRAVVLIEPHAADRVGEVSIHMPLPFIEATKLKNAIAVRRLYKTAARATKLGCNSLAARLTTATDRFIPGPSYE